MFFEKNTRALLKSKPQAHELVALLSKTAPASDFELMETEQGDFTLNYRGSWLHDPKGAQQEARETASANCQPGAGRIHILLGLGMGYLLQEVYRSFQGRIVVYEPDLPLLRFVLDNVDLSEFLGSGRVWLVAHPADLIETIRPLFVFATELDILLLRGYAPLFADGLTSLLESLYQTAESRIVDYATANHYHSLWMERFFTNLPCFADMDNLDELADRLKDKPAVVISAGPSLDAALEDLRDMQDSVVTIAVGTVLRRLYQAGIAPDFTLFCDAKGMREQLEGIPEAFLRQTRFVLPPIVESVCFSAPAGRHLLMLSQNSPIYAGWLDQTLGKEHRRIPGGGTVSLFAFQAARLMGCNPIILAGQDLAMPNNQLYAGGTTIWQDEQGRAVLETTDTQFGGSFTMAEVPGQNGETLPTLKMYAGFLQHFEAMAADIRRAGNGPRLINASIGGALIRGFELMPLSAVQKELAQASGPASEWRQALLPPLTQACTPGNNRRQKLSEHLIRLETAVNQAIQLLNRPEDRPSHPVSQKQQRWLEFLNAEPLIGHFVSLETIAYERALHKADTDLPAARAEWFAQCRKVLLEQALPLIKQAQVSLKPRSTAA